MKSLTLIVLVVLLSFGPAIAQDSSNVTKIGEESSFWSTGNQVVIRDSIAFYATFGTGIRLIDIRDRENPQEIGVILPGKSISEFKFVGDLVYCVGRGTGLVCVDISDIERPRERGSYSAENGYWTYAGSLAITGNIAYVGYGRAGLQVIDIADPDSLRQIGVVDQNASTIYNTAIKGNALYYITSSYLKIFDITDRASPRYVGILEDHRMDRFALSGNHLYSGLSSEISSFDVTDEFNPIAISVFDDDHIFGLNAVENRLYVATQFGFSIVNVSDPFNPSLISDCRLNGRCLAVAIDHDLAVVSSSSKGVLTVDISDEESPQAVGEIARPVYAGDIGLFDHYALLLDPDSGFWMFDVNQPETIHQLGACLIDDLDEGDFVIQNQRAYVASQNYLSVVDLSSVDSIRLVTRIERGGWGIVVNSNKLCINFQGSLYYFDITNPDRPITIAQRYSEIEISAFSMTEDYLYLGISNEVIKVLDLNDPNNLNEVGSIFINGDVNDIKYVGGYLYVANGELGLRIIDVHDPRHPRAVAMLNTPGVAHEVEILGNRAVVADGPAGLRIIDISEPRRPRDFGFYDTQGCALNLEIGSDSLIYVADSTNFSVYDMSEALVIDSGNQSSPISFELSTPYPNPFNATTRFSIDLPEASQVSISVFNTTGERVSDLTSGIYSAGHHAIEWDARECPAGAYVIRVKAGDLELSRKVTLTK